MKRTYTILISILLLSFGAVFMNDVQAYSHEVWQSGSLYYWKTFDVERGSSSDLATAIQGAISTGSREVHILCGGTLSAQINLQAGLTLYCHNNTFNKNHSGYGFHIEGSGPINIYDMTLNNNSNMGIRTSRAGDLRFVNVKITGGSIGIRVDSHPSRPYEEGRWVYNLYVQDCTFENTSSHGLETYGVDGCSVYGIIARNCGECGVLLNKTINGTIGTVHAYRCCYGGGYAGLRFANSCSNVTANMLYADECGRGFFVLSGSNNCHLNNCQITDCTDVGIWLENVENCSVEAGCSNCGVAVSGSGSYANVSSSCSSASGTYYQLQKSAAGLAVNSMENGSATGQLAGNQELSMINIKSVRNAEFEPTNSKLVSVYPNPSSNGKFTIDLSNASLNDEINVEIHSSNGQKIFVKKYHKQTLIDLDLSLEQGVYLLMVNDGNRMINSKVIIK